MNLVKFAKKLHDTAPILSQQTFISTIRQNGYKGSNEDLRELYKVLYKKEKRKYQYKKQTKTQKLLEQVFKEQTKKNKKTTKINFIKKAMSEGSTQKEAKLFYESKTGIKPKKYITKKETLKYFVDVESKMGIITIPLSKYKSQELPILKRTIAQELSFNYIFEVTYIHLEGKNENIVTTFITIVRDDYIQTKADFLELFLIAEKTIFEDVELKYGHTNKIIEVLLTGYTTFYGVEKFIK